MEYCVESDDVVVKVPGTYTWIYGAVTAFLKFRCGIILATNTNNFDHVFCIYATRAFPQILITVIFTIY